MEHKNIVSVPSTPPLTTWSNRPISLENYLIQNCLCFGFLIGCMSYMETSGSSEMVALDIFFRILVLCHLLSFSCKNFRRKLANTSGVSFT